MLRNIIDVGKISRKLIKFTKYRWKYAYRGLILIVIIITVRRKGKFIVKYDIRRAETIVVIQIRFRYNQWIIHERIIITRRRLNKINWRVRKR